MAEEEIIRTEYSELMRKSYIDYAMSVIIARALPDVRDGLKPVQRRVLYDMNELGIKHDRPYRKSARIVGDTMGKYHPHGDSSIYDSLVVMAQDFKKGLPLVDGHGNFGSIEGDGAAAMRYTEARLQKITEEVFLQDLDLDVVDFMPNFDETEKEPKVLPVRIPNILINGSEGIAVGMATSIPPHNLGEVIDGTIAYLKNPDMSTKQMMKYIKGPDFPTGGIVANKDELESIYSTGVGKIRLRGKTVVEQGKNGKVNIVVTEIPYTMIGAGIGKFLNDVAHLVETKVTNDITDISNQSGKDGIRIVIELRRGADIDNVLNLLYKKTRLEDTFGVNMLAVADGRPETLGLVPLIRHHVEFQYELATRKYTTLLQKARDKKEIEEGLIKACDVIDLIIEILRGSKTRVQAKECLVHGVTEGIRFKSETSRKDAAKLLFTERQADAILEMRLYKLIGLEIDALQKEYKETMQKIADYTDILSNKASMAKTIIEDLKYIKKEFEKPRKTDIDVISEAVFEEKPVEEAEVAVMIDRFFYAKEFDLATLERNKEAINEEARFLFTIKNTDKLCLFTDSGNMHTLKVMDIPIVKFRDKGMPIDNLSNFDSSKENTIFIGALTDIKEKKLIFATKNGLIKIVSGEEFDSVSRKTILASKLSDDDRIVFIGEIEGNDNIIFRTKNHYFLRIEASQVPEQKKTALGVKGIALSSGDEVTDIYILHEGEEKTIEVDGKNVILHNMKILNRAAKGTKR